MPIDTPFEHEALALAAADAAGRADAAETIASTAAEAAIAIHPTLLTINSLLWDCHRLDAPARELFAAAPSAGLRL